MKDGWARSRSIPQQERSDMSRGAVLPSQLPKAGKLRIAVAYYATYVLLGLMLTCIGPSLDALQAQSGSSTEAIALLFTANALGYIAGSVLAGRMYARIAGNRVLPAALLILALLTLTVPGLASLASLIVVFAFIGIPLGIIDVGGNTLMVWLFRDDVPPYMNALHLSFGVGAFMGPLVFDRFAVATGNAATTFWLLAALMIPVALWLARLPSPDSPDSSDSPGAAKPGPAAPDVRGVVRRYSWLIGLIALFFFMHMGAELAFGGWIFTYADEATGSETIARLLNSVFWGGLVVGRLVAIPLALRLTPRAMLQLDLAGAVASLALLILLPDSTPALWIGTIGFGFSIASMIASSFNLAERRMPITSQVSSVFLVGGSLGSMTLPWLVGQLFVPYGRISVMYVTGAAILAACFLLWLIVLRERRPGQREPVRRETPAA
jgi:FHS family Na+ dependent glucose MFS transporter 1